MGKHIQRTPRTPDNNGGGGIKVSYRGLGAIGAAIPILAAMWFTFTAIATKSDVESIKAAITPQINQHEARIRELELQNAAHFGASPARTPAIIEDMPVEKARFLLAQLNLSQMAQVPSPPISTRRAVLPMDFIRLYELEPSRGGFYPLQGEDGRLYALDDVVNALVVIHMAEVRRALQQRK